MVSLYLGNTYKLQGGGRGGVLSIRCDTTWSSLRASTPTPACVTYRLHHGSSTIPTRETIEVYSHIGTHATPAVDSPRLKIVTVTYEFSEASSDTLPLIAVYVTCSPGSSIFSHYRLLVRITGS